MDKSADSGHLAEAIEAVARMLPAAIPPGGQWPVARAAVQAAMPHLVAHVRPDTDADLVERLLTLHSPVPPDPDGLRVCRECLTAWPCRTALLCGTEHA